MSRAFLHVGSPKTGTTFLQSVLWKAREEAKEQGLLLPLSSVHHHFRAALDLRGAMHLAADPNRLAGAWDKVVDGSAGWHGDVLVSHEVLCWASTAQAKRAIDGFRAQGREPHIVITARDLARQLPAEWQERVKARSTMSFTDYLAAIRDPEDPTARHTWQAQDFADIARRWGAEVPAERIHVVTVPPSGAPKDLLWRRFAVLLGLDPDRFDLDVARPNESLGVEQAELLRRLNGDLRGRLVRPGPYPKFVKGGYAHGVLSARPGTKITLAGDDLEFARERSARVVRDLDTLGVDVVGDLSELIVATPPQPDEVSSPRIEVTTEQLLTEAVEGNIGLIERAVERQEAHRAEVRELRRELTRERKRSRRLARERDRFASDAAAPVRHLARDVRRRAGVLARRARRVVGAQPDDDGQGAEAAAAPTPPKVTFLMYNVNGMGGVARTTINVANALAEHYEVEILSLNQRRSEPTFEIDPRVTVTYLLRTHLKARRLKLTPEEAEVHARPSVLYDVTPVVDKYSALTDRVFAEALGELGPDDILIPTRPSLNVVAAHFTRDGAERPMIVAWDHMNYELRFGEDNEGVARTLDHALPLLDGLVVLTEADAEDYRRRHPRLPVRKIANAVGWPPADPRPPHDERVVVAAGRLSEATGFDLLSPPWELLAEEFPDWECRIHGSGTLRATLQEQIDVAGVKVQLAGYSDDMANTLREAAIYVMSSRREGFGMTLTEALTQGTPVVSFDCPRGPGEIVVDGSNGRLVPDGDVPALAAALGELMRDRPLRDRMGEQGLRDAREYELASIAEQWRELIEELRTATHRTAPHRIATHRTATHTEGR